MDLVISSEWRNNFIRQDSSEPKRKQMKWQTLVALSRGEISLMKSLVAHITTLSFTQIHNLCTWTRHLSKSPPIQYAYEIISECHRLNARPLNLKSSVAFALNLVRICTRAATKLKSRWCSYIKNELKTVLSCSILKWSVNAVKPSANSLHVRRLSGNRARYQPMSCSTNSSISLGRISQRNNLFHKVFALCAHKSDKQIIMEISTVFTLINRDFHLLAKLIQISIGFHAATHCLSYRNLFAQIITGFETSITYNKLIRFEYDISW